MIFGKKRRYDLPKFPPRTRAVFWSLCEELPEDQVRDLENLLRGGLELLREQMKGVAYANIQAVDELENACLHLVSIYKERPSREKKLIVGAVRYLVVDEDALSDVHFATGLDDDIQVVNFVLEELGIEGRFLRKAAS